MLMLLDESLNGPYQQHESLPTNPQKDSLSTRSQSRHSDGYPMVGRVENKLLRGEYSGMIPFPLEHNSSSNSCSDDEVNATQKKIQTICSKVQTLLQPLISNLLTIAGNSNDAYINSSRVQPTINSNSNSINRLQTSGLPTSQPTASPSSAATTSKTSPRGSTGSTTLISPRGGAKLNRNVRLVYNNTINRAVKSNVYKGGFEVGLLWPQMLPSSSAISSNGNNNTASVKGNLANKGSGSGNRTGEVLPVGTPRNGVKTAQRSPPQNTRVPLLNSSSQSTLSTSSATAGGSPYLHNELPRWLIRQLKNQYAIPASFLTGMHLYMHMYMCMYTCMLFIYLVSLILLTFSVTKT